MTVHTKIRPRDVPGTLLNVVSNVSRTENVECRTMHKLRHFH